MSGGWIIDPEGNFHDTEGHISHGEWLRLQRPEWKEAFNMLKMGSLIENVDEELYDELEEEEDDVRFDLEQRLLEQALDKGWIRARKYAGKSGDEVNVQYGGDKKPSSALVGAIFKKMGLSPRDIRLLVDKGGKNVHDGTLSTWSDCLLKQIHFPNHLIDGTRRTL